MGWFSSNNAADSTPTPTTTSTSTPEMPSSIPPPPSSSSESSSPQNHEADFNATFPHLAPQPSPTKDAGPQLSPEYPTTMSCRAAFDSAFYCSSLGGHFNHVYRYGELKPCSEHWADWRFCMRIKTQTEAAKAQLIQERFMEKEAKLKSKPNSENVWERRGPDERHLGAFAPEEEVPGRN